MSERNITCPACGYPHAAPACDNPACEANPRVTQAQKDYWATERAKRAARAAEDAERQRARDIHRRMMTGGR
jgi:hypothetical protein